MSSCSALCVASQPIHAEGLESVRLLDEAVGVATAHDHPPAGRTSVRIGELADQPFVAARKGHWPRRLLDRLFAARDRIPKIVCEVDEPSAIADLISAGLGIGLVPALARRTAVRAPIPRIAVDDPDCRRTITLFRGADSHLSTAARLMRATITSGTGSPANHKRNTDDRGAGAASVFVDGHLTSWGPWWGYPAHGVFSSPGRRPAVYATVRRYEGVTDPAEAGRRVSEGFVPLIRPIPGFVAYYWVDAGDGVMVSTSVFEDRAGAEESSERAADFVRDNLAALLPNPPQVTVGEVVASG